MLPVFVIGLHYADPNNYTQLHRTSCLLAILLLIGILRLPPVIRLMEWKPLMHLGKLSFGLYVLHWPVMCSLSAWLFLSSVHLQSTAGRLGVLLVTSLVCYLLSYLFYRYVDAASIKAGALFSRRLDDTVQSSGPLLITPTSPAQNG
jgi:peptidoglycan/LPS O-acetylase OafA/YrhL